ncbi:hydrocephalus-inducing protein homolog [Augochlora pura]
MKLAVLVRMGLETPTVVLTGRGIEKSLTIDEPVIQFLPVVPYTCAQDAAFAIGNASDYPVEFFWHHINRTFHMDDQVVNTLLDYYGVEEILLPPSKPGDPLPADLIKFYNDLVDEMARVRSIQELEQEEYPGSEHRLDKSTSYTESLHDTSEFRARMGDPVKEYFESIERKSGPLNDLPDPARPEKKVCIIFHGAPFTEYQDTACRSARVLAAPVLSIDKAITEAIALGESEYSITLRQIIDNAYQNYTEARERQKEAAGSEGKSKGSGRGRQKSPRSEKTVDTSREGKKRRTERSPETEASEPKQEVILLRLPEESDPLIELNKIPDADRLETLDPLSRYEYKIQAILQFEKILGKDYSTVSSPAKDSRSVRENVKTAFLGTDPNLLVEVLTERLSAEDFKRGFVLQSLENKLLHGNPVETLMLLLRIVGQAEYFLFVTFLNSMANYNRHTDELRHEHEKTGDAEKRIQDIEEMSLSEYELLNDEDKEMYLEAVLPALREKAWLRRSRFAERKMNQKKGVGGRVSRSKTPMGKGKEKSSEPRHTGNKKPASSKRSGGAKSKDSSRREREKVPMGISQITEAMNRYQSDLSTMLDLIRHWDPEKKAVESFPATKSKTSKSDKTKDLMSSEHHVSNSK